ncbi:MAG: tetratricopeptide repeat protein [Chthoniobacterales bacterium]
MSAARGIFLRVLALSLAATGAGFAQKITLENGKVIFARSLTRQGDTLLAEVSMPGAGTAKIGTPINQIASIEFPEPPEIASASALVASGKSEEALAVLQLPLATYEALGNMPGTWLPDLEVLKLQALIGVGKISTLKEAAIPQGAKELEWVMTLQNGAVLAAAGKHDKAIELFSAALDKSANARVLATAAVLRGESLLARKDWAAALLSVLQIPVFYPDEKGLMPPVLLDSARAYLELHDFASARIALKELKQNYASTAQGGQADKELARVDKLDAALAPPK